MRSSARPIMAISAFLIIALFAPGLARAQSTPLGPGPFASIKLKPKGILFVVDGSASDATLFKGSPSISVEDGGAELAFSAAPKVKKAGARLQQAGTLGGRSIDSVFAEGQLRRMTIHNGDGGTTTLEVTRRGAALTVGSIVREPGGGSAGPSAVLTATREVQGTSDSSTDLKLGPEAGPTGVLVTVDASLPPAPPSATSASVVLHASSASNASASGRSAAFEVAGQSVEMKLILPADSYRLTAEYTVVIGSLSTSEVTITRRFDVAQSIAVSASNDRFSVELPDIALPSLQPATVALSGAAQFEPPPSGATAALVTLATASQDGNLSVGVAAMRELGGSGTASIALSAPAGSYQGAVSVLPSVAASGGQVAANYHVASLVLQSVSLPGTVQAAFPTMTRIPSSIRDTTNLLSPADLAHPGAVAHIVSLTGIVGFGSTVVTSAAIVLDDSKDFGLYFPAGAVGTVLPVLDLSGALPDGRALENVTLTYNPGLFFAAPPARIDLVVPSIARTVAVAGRVIDPDSAPVAGATAAAFTATVQGLTAGAVSGLYVTESDGRFRFDVPPATTYTLTAVYEPTTAKTAKRAGLLPILAEHLAALGR